MLITAYRNAKNQIDFPIHIHFADIHQLGSTRQSNIGKMIILIISMMTLCSEYFQKIGKGMLI